MQLRGRIIINNKIMRASLILRERVDHILNTNEKARANDALLVFEVWKHFASIKGITLDDGIYELLQDYFPDTITRIRRKLNQEELYLPPKEVQLKRKRNEVDHREAYRDNPDKELAIWTNKDGEKIELFRMNDEYIVNVIKYLQKRLSDLEVFSELVPKEARYQADKDMDTIIDWLSIFKDELKKRISLDDINDKIIC